jgi:putative transposase
MNNATHIRTGKHVVFLLHAHLVFVTKYRKAVFTKNMLNDIADIFLSVCQDFEAKLIEFDGEADHVHLLINYPPKVSISKLVNSLKGVSSRMLRSNFKNEISKLLWKNALWSPSYFAGSCGGAPLKIIKEYIQSQQTPA